MSSSPSTGSMPPTLAPSSDRRAHRPRSAGSIRPRPRHRHRSTARRCATACSRRSWSVVWPALFMFGTGAPYGAAPEFDTIELRRQFIAGLTALPLALRGLLGQPINLETMGGFLSWRVGNFLPVLLGLWPVVALSGILAGEAAKGSLDAAGDRRRRAVGRSRSRRSARTLRPSRSRCSSWPSIIWAVGAFFAKLPGDEIPISAALGQVVLYGVMMLAPGRSRSRPRRTSAGRGPGVRADRAVRELPDLQLRQPVAGDRCADAAVVLPLDRRTPADGRRVGLGLGGVPRRRGRRPAGDRCRWPSSGATSGPSTTSAGCGCRRCLPASPAHSAGSWPTAPASRSRGGSGSACTASSSWPPAQAFSDSIASLPQIAALIRLVYPGVDLSQPSGVLQLTFFGFGSFIFTLAGASYLAGWASDEGRRRLEVVLTAPVSRADGRSGARSAPWPAIAVTTAVVAVLIGARGRVAGR